MCLWAACHNHRSEVVFRADACVEFGRGEVFEWHSRSCTGRVNHVGRSTAILTSWPPGCARIHACCWRDRDDRQQRDRSRSAGCGQVLRVLLTRRCRLRKSSAAIEGCCQYRKTYVCDTTHLTSIMSLLIALSISKEAGSSSTHHRTKASHLGHGCRDLRAALSIVDRGVGIASGMALHRRSGRQRSGT